VNIVKYFRIYQFVAPKRAQLEEQNEKLNAANAKLKIVRDKVEALQNKLAHLTAQFDKATDEKNEAEAQARRTRTRADTAHRLVAAGPVRLLPASGQPRGAACRNGPGPGHGPRPAQCPQPLRAVPISLAPGVGAGI
jgi:septal ring factor EnvC (AmiA/AmiB activator)